MDKAGDEGEVCYQYVWVLLELESLDTQLGNFCFCFLKNR